VVHAGQGFQQNLSSKASDKKEKTEREIVNKADVCNIPTPSESATTVTTLPTMFPLLCLACLDQRRGRQYLLDLHTTEQHQESRSLDP
jgi:hypothetical protein